MTFLVMWKLCGRLEKNGSRPGSSGFRQARRGGAEVVQGEVQVGIASEVLVCGLCELFPDHELLLSRSLK